MRKIIAAVSAGLAGLVGLVLLVGYSPAVCGCVPPFDVLVFHSGANPITANTDVSAAGIEARLNRSLAGTAVRLGNFPYTSDQGCSQSQPDRIVCKVPIAKSRFFTRGMVVTYEVRGGVFQRARVRSSYWL